MAGDNIGHSDAKSARSSALIRDSVVPAAHEFRMISVSDCGAHARDGLASAAGSTNPFVRSRWARIEQQWTDMADRAEAQAASGRDLAERISNPSCSGMGPQGPDEAAGRDRREPG
jgi:hypothetical protein